MRLPLLAAAATAAVALPLAPANAAVYPVCATQVAPVARPTASCSAGNTPYDANRQSRVVVETGAVDATLTCYAPWGNRTDSERVYSGTPVTLTAREYAGNSCTTTLVSLTDATLASVVSFPLPVIYTTPPPPASS